MFGHDSAPTRIYSYGAKAPIAGAEAVDEQMRLAHHYRNQLVEAERNRRRLVDATLAELSPRLAAVEAEIAVAERQVEVSEIDLNREQAWQRKKVRPAILIEALRAARARRKTLWDERKTIRHALFGERDAAQEALKDVVKGRCEVCGRAPRLCHALQPDYAAPAVVRWLCAQHLYPVAMELAEAHWSSVSRRLDAIEAASTLAIHELRALCGCYSGTYLHVEDSMRNARSGAPPQFAAWRGDGHIAVQLQGGLSVADLERGCDSRLAIEPAPPAPRIAKNGALLPQSTHDRRRIVRFRVDSTDAGAPVWAVIPIALHRPLPEDAAIKWAHLIRQRIGTHYEWRVQVVLSRAAGWEPEDRAASGIAGIDIGWRLRPGGMLRVAYWVGDDGAEGELLLPDSAASRGQKMDGRWVHLARRERERADRRPWLSQMRKTEGIQSIRDGLFNGARDKLAAWLDSTELPEWLREKTALLSAWHSQARLAAVVIQWRGARFRGDEAVFEMLKAWRRRDKHLLEYEASLRDQLQRARHDCYKRFAAAMRRRYRTLVVEALDLREFHRLPRAEEAAKSPALTKHIRDACLSELLGALRESGAVSVPPEYTTLNCSACGAEASCERLDDTALLQRCSRCGQLEDQDRNAATNLLRAAGTNAMDGVGVGGRSK